MRSITLISLLALSSTTVACNNDVPTDKNAGTMSEDSSGPDEERSSADTETETETETQEDSETETEEDSETETEEDSETETEEDSETQEDSETETEEDSETETETGEDLETGTEAEEDSETEVDDTIDTEPDVILTDDDGDSYTDGLDCDDSNPDIHPSAEEYCDDGIDSDCRGGDSNDGDCTELTPADVLGMIECTGEPERIRITSDYLDISYNSQGFWNTRSALFTRGFRFSDGESEWVNLASTSTEAQRMLVSFNLDRLGGFGSHDYDSSFTPSSGDFQPSCMEAVAIGNVIGVQHVYEMDDDVTITKTELWDQDAGTILINVKVTPPSGGTVQGLDVSHFSRSEIGGYSDSRGDSSSDDRFAAAIARGSSWSFGYGLCDSSRETVGASAWWQIDTDPDMCLPGEDYESSRIFGWASVEPSRSFGARMGGQSVSMVVSTGTTSAEAEAGYEDWAEDLCGSAYEAGSPADIDTCG
jgi:hypothetical protein